VEVIPVIDLRAGMVVHARGGVRAGYRPVRSHLCADSTPLPVVRALLGVYPFASLYVADLDAIDGRAGHAAEIAEIARAFPGLALSVDCGLRDARGCREWRGRDLATPVVGTEVLADTRALRELAEDRDPETWILSLDYRGDRLLGGASLADTVAYWPSRVIVMTLARVGSGEGPDVDRLDEIRTFAGARRIYAAGGVRGGADLVALRALGISGALVATAFHAGGLDRAGIAAVASGPA
jgi:phosphoribosylformimino-5-aminoimidazole carboxamide ribotide isomerase